MIGIVPLSPLMPISKTPKIVEKDKQGNSRPKQKSKQMPLEQLDNQPIQHIDESV
jgi:hypothetical protein